MATFTCQPPNHFDFASPNNWPQWLRRFERFRSVSGLKNKTAEEQIDALIYSMGDRAETILHALQLSDTDGKIYSKVVDAFEAHFVGKRNVIFERAKFNIRQQQEGEGVDEFITALHTLARHCAFGELNDEFIRDRIVVGVRDRRLSDKMQLDSELTLQRATMMARQSERIKVQQATLNQEKDGNVDRIHTFKTKEMDKVQTGDWKKEPRKLYRRCYGCGATEHLKRDCPARAAACHSCGKKGHYSKVCQSKAGIREITTEGDREPAFLGRVRAEISGQQKWVVPVFVQSRLIHFKVDTGADVNVIPKKDFKASFPNMRLDPVDRRLIGPDGALLDAIGMFQGGLQFKERTVTSTIYVVRGATQALLSGGASEKLGMLKRLCSIVESSSCNPLLEFPELFKGLGHAECKFGITLTAEAKPFALSTPRRVPLPLMEKVKKQLDEMVATGVIESVEEPTEWCAPMVIAPKQSGGVRLCVDLSHLNKFIKREFHPMPVSDHVLGQIGSAKYFSKLDAYWGFWQFELEETSRTYTTFISPFGRYRFKRLPFGITSAPEFFQRKMTQLLGDIVGVTCNMDDILIFACTAEEHDRRLRQVLGRIKQAGFTLNPDKCEFKKMSIKYLGHRIDGKGIHPDRDKVKAIVEMKPPKNVSELKSFLGMVSYHRKFIPNLSTLGQPLSELLKSTNSWIWGGSQEEAFKALKDALGSAPVLAKYDPTKETTVSADASSYGLGAVMRQLQADGNTRPVAYASRTLNPAERRYAQVEKEGLALVWACEKFSDYITGIPIHLETDHKPLVPIFASKTLDELTPRLQRMKMRLMRYSYDIYHTPGKQLVTADALSRKPLEETEGEFQSEATAYINMVIQGTPISDPLLQWIATEQAKDERMGEIRRCLTQGWPGRHKVSTYLRPYWLHRADISEVSGLLLKSNRLIVPKAIQREILNRLHEGHLGISKCRLRAQASVWWPGISANVRDMVTACDTCAKERKNQREPLNPSENATRPWQKIAMDLFYLDQHWYLLITDYYSRYPEIALLSGLTPKVVIGHIKSMFARHGIPELVISDNGPQFVPHFGSEFSQFAREWGFVHRTSSPRYPQSNGFVEAAVKVIKRSIKKEGDSYKALLSYRMTPLSNGYTPAELLFGRRLRTRVPLAENLLKPRTINEEEIIEKEIASKARQKKDYDRLHRTQELPQLAAGKRVWVVDLKVEGVVTGQAGSPRSYYVETRRGHVRRNRIHLVPIHGSPTSPVSEPDDDLQEAASSPGSIDKENEHLAAVDHPESAVQQNEHPRLGAEESTSIGMQPLPTVTRFGRIVRRPKGLEDYV